MKKLFLSVVLVFGLANAANVNLNNLELEPSQSAPVLTTIGIGGISAEDEGIVVKIVEENITTFLPFNLDFYADISNVGYQKYTFDTYITRVVETTAYLGNDLNLWGGIGFEKFKFQKEKKQQFFFKYLGILDNNDFNPFLELDIGSESVNLNAGIISRFKNSHFSTEFKIWKRFIYDNGDWDDLKGLFTVNYTF